MSLGKIVSPVRLYTTPLFGILKSSNWGGVYGHMDTCVSETQNLLGGDPPSP